MGVDVEVLNPGDGELLYVRDLRSCWNAVTIVWSRDRFYLCIPREEVSEQRSNCDSALYWWVSVHV